MSTPKDVTLTELQFCQRAVLKLRRDPYKGIHTVFSGFNSGWKEYFGTDPVAGTRKLAGYVLEGDKWVKRNEGQIFLTPAKRGCMIYLNADDVPNSTAKKALATMGL